MLPGLAVAVSFGAVALIKGLPFGTHACSHVLWVKKKQKTAVILSDGTKDSVLFEVSTDLEQDFQNKGLVWERALVRVMQISKIVTKVSAHSIVRVRGCVSHGGSCSLLQDFVFLASYTTSSTTSHKIFPDFPTSSTVVGRLRRGALVAGVYLPTYHPSHALVVFQQFQFKEMRCLYRPTMFVVVASCRHGKSAHASHFKR